jgi:hypothetical protein
MPPAELVSGEVCVQQVTPGGEVVGGGRQAHCGTGRGIVVGLGVRPRLPACAPLPGEALTGHRLVMFRAVIVMFRAATGQLQ